MKEKNIEFIKTDTFQVADEFAPIPSSKIIPSWYKDMSSYITDNQKTHAGGSTGTIKKCIPVFDSLTSGYMIVTHCDIRVKVVNGLPDFIYPPSTNAIGSHPRIQAEKYPDFPKNEMFIAKYTNPWGIKTSPGYSCIFMPPMHRDNYLIILPGIVDTDTYNDTISFPFILKSKEDCDFTIPAGTPIAQVIPFKRESWIMSISKDFDLLRKSRALVLATFFGGYKKRFWHKKQYR